MSALNQKSSIWKSHSQESGTHRRPFRPRSQRQHYPSGSESTGSIEGDEGSDTESVLDNGGDENSDTGTDYDNLYDTDDNFEPPIIVESKKWSGKHIT